ncbi:Cell division protein ZapA [Candidatus Hydrogenisulfobacillus filiaventi]|uniref:Cell division protein ZapA n=1 Tax=Candidatus Hydrogenisulfobacillus filiaventi TaxID=2707344 RepID=A0A6F8ZEQ7_9FIRM|nr:cell division protein ZapA [Bacillota bacterium]CAB1128411.1 Cell division protein ZapA [Candidatus Hydrogenisulfobacillus filiaventi]
MEDGQTRTTVSIYGEDYAIRSDLPPETVEELARYVDTRMRVLAARNPHVPAGRLAILVALNCAEEVLRLEAKTEELTAALQQRWRSRQVHKKGS